MANNNSKSNGNTVTQLCPRLRTLAIITKSNGTFNMYCLLTCNSNYAFFNVAEVMVGNEK